MKLFSGAKKKKKTAAPKPVPASLSEAVAESGEQGNSSKPKSPDTTLQGAAKTQTGDPKPQQEPQTAKTPSSELKTDPQPQPLPEPEPQPEQEQESEPQLEQGPQTEPEPMLQAEAEVARDEQKPDLEADSASVAGGGTATDANAAAATDAPPDANDGLGSEIKPEATPDPEPEPQQEDEPDIADTEIPLTVVAPTPFTVHVDGSALRTAWKQLPRPNVPALGHADQNQTALPHGEAEDEGMDAIPLPPPPPPAQRPGLSSTPATAAAGSALLRSALLCAHCVSRRMEPALSDSAIAVAQVETGGTGPRIVDDEENIPISSSEPGRGPMSVRDKPHNGSSDSERQRALSESLAELAVQRQRTATMRDALRHALVCNNTGRQSDAAEDGGGDDVDQRGASNIDASHVPAARIHVRQSFFECRRAGRDAFALALSRSAAISRIGDGKHAGSAGAEAIHTPAVGGDKVSATLIEQLRAGGAESLDGDLGSAPLNLAQFKRALRPTSKSRAVRRPHGRSRRTRSGIAPLKRAAAAASGATATQQTRMLPCEALVLEQTADAPIVCGNDNLVLPFLLGVESTTPASPAIMTGSRGMQRLHTRRASAVQLSGVQIQTTATAGVNASLT